MEPIKMELLKVGDIFCHELKLNGREAFEVMDIKISSKTSSILCRSRTTFQIKNKKIEGNVILLKRNE